MSRPNIVYILADDLGYGDIACNAADCRIATPHIDALAERGMRFTDAHATSAICSPSRYSILTGRYAWKTQLKRSVLWAWDAPLIEPGQPTVPRLLRDHGYRTACIGKWHLGWDWATKDGTKPNDTLPYGVWCDSERAAYEDNIDYERPIGGGPVDHGFDNYFGVDVPNFPPYTWFEDDTIASPPTEPKPDEVYGHPGGAVAGWDPYRIIPECTRRATDFIADAATEAARPFFLYLALTSPHSPIVPNDAFRGVSGIGDYGDFVCEVDWVVGQVVGVLDHAGCFDNTLVIFTSDNGPEIQMLDDEGAYTRARRTQHYSMGPLRGIKRDVWEGGHRVPFVASWPRVIPTRSTSDELVSLSDLFATCADVLEVSTTDLGELDSESMLPALTGDGSGRSSLVLHSGGGRFALRQGPWLLIDAPTGGEIPEPDWFRHERGYTAHDQPGELFNLDSDLAERDNVYGAQPGLVSEIMSALAQLVGDNRVRSVDPPVPTTE